MARDDSLGTLGNASKKILKIISSKLEYYMYRFSLSNYFMSVQMFLLDNIIDFFQNFFARILFFGEDPEIIFKEKKN